MIKTDDVKKIILEWPNSTIGKTDLDGLAVAVVAYLDTANINEEIERATLAADFNEVARLINIRDGHQA